MTNKNIPLATRPGYGAAGRPIDLTTNFFLMSIRTGQYYQYHVDIKPEVEGRKMKTTLFNKVSQIAKFGAHVFDGSILFSKVKVTNINEQVEHKGTDYSVEIKYTSTISTQNLPPETAQLFNIMIRRVYREIKLVPVQRKYFDPSRPYSIPKHKIEIWPGFSSSIYGTECGIILNIDVARKVLTTDSVLQMMKDFFGKPNHQEIINKEFSGQIVMTRYNNRTYRIDRVDFTRSPKFQFEINGEKVTIANHVKVRHGLQVKDMNQPLLVCENKKQGGEVLLIPELCCRTGLTDEMIEDYRIMKDVGEYTRVPPAERVQSLIDFRTSLKEKKAQGLLDDWGIKIDDQMKQTKGRVFPPEVIYLKNKQQAASPTADWTSLMRGDELLKVVHLKPRKWVLICTEREADTMNQFLATFKKVAGPMKIDVGEPIVQTVASDRADAYINALKAILQPDFQIVIFILPTNRKDRYDQLKDFLSTQMPIPSQCITAKTLQKEKMLMSVCTKICVQVQAKCGAQIWQVQIPLTKIMVIGIDVYHDTVRKGESVLAFCATFTDNCTRLFSIPLFQRSGQEIADNLSRCMGEALQFYFAQNKILPQTIFVYRDGVGDGQLDAVHKLEIPQLRRAFDQFQGYNPKMAVIVVKKRISARFFEARTLSNPPPGTVVDRDVIGVGIYDFYLIAQHVTQGSATPTHYHVLVDNTGLKPDHLQMLTYKLCHMYFNWSGTVRVPAPCQYAHKLAFLVGQSIHKSPHKRLASNLYYL